MCYKLGERCGIERFIEQVGANYEKVKGLKPEFYIAEYGNRRKKLFEKFTFISELLTLRPNYVTRQ